MFTASDRDAVRERLLAAAAADPAVTATAVVGSRARGAEDAWSDVDLAFRLAPGADVAQTADRWSADMSSEHDAVASVDVWAGPALYRVFLLDSSLQVDLSFWPDAEFGAPAGMPMQLVFGSVAIDRPARLTEDATTIGMAWLWALHVRSSLARGRLLQAVFTLGQLRDAVTELACRRRGLPDTEGRGVDDLPPELHARLVATVPAAVAPDHLAASFAAAVDLLLDEADATDPELVARVARPLRVMLRSLPA